MNFGLRAVFVSMLLLFVCPMSSWAQAPLGVVRLRADEVVLTPVDKGQKATERVVRRSEVSEANPWPVKEPRNVDGTLNVVVDGKEYKVAEVDVVTNAPRKAAACFDRTAPRVGATRGVQEAPPCK